MSVPKMLVRIFPVSRRHGHKCRSYKLSGSDYPPFRVERGWYEVDPATAEKLKAKRNNSADPRSAPIFQVCTAEEKEALEEAELAKAGVTRGPVPIPAAVNAKAAAKALPEKAERQERAFRSRGSKEANLRAGKFLETADADDDEPEEKPVAKAQPVPAPQETEEDPEGDPEAELDAALDEALPEGEELSEPMASANEQAQARPASTPTVQDARATTKPPQGGDLTSGEVRENSTPEPKTPPTPPPAAQGSKLTKPPAPKAVVKPSRKAASKSGK